MHYAETTTWQAVDNGCRRRLMRPPMPCRAAPKYPAKPARGTVATWIVGDERSAARLLAVARSIRADDAQDAGGTS